MPKHIPTSEEIPWKPLMVERYKRITDFEKFKEYSLAFLKKSIRVNTLKISIADLKKRLEADWNLEQVPFCKEGFWITHKREDRRDIGNLPEHALGYFYVQEAASMLPPLALQPQEGDVVLDICAAPGSKTTQLGAMMKNTGLVVANDIVPTRLEALKINTQRCGLTNCIITKIQGYRFEQIGIKFDKILLDAPCSGTGTIRKSLKTIRIFNVDMLKKISGEQKQLIRIAFQNLKEGGVMTYSTCSVEPEEDEAVVDFLLKECKNAKLEEIDLKIKRGEPVLEWEGKKFSHEIKKCLRIWPQDNDTEGFFVAKIRKV